MADDEFTCDLFRFLQLLCEGHNNGELLFFVFLLKLIAVKNLGPLMKLLKLLNLLKT